jgi:Asp-tRNA(Asn)/Glu-tRNA(Gln) amidotransferase C subunit
MPGVEDALELTASLARANGLELSRERLRAVAQGLADLLEMAAGLEELPLEGVEPAGGPPRWE